MYSSHLNNLMKMINDYLFLKENKFIQQAIVSTDMQ